MRCALEQLVEFPRQTMTSCTSGVNFGFHQCAAEATRCAASSSNGALLPPDVLSGAWTGSNHDMFRFPTRWAADDLRRIGAALVILFGLRGTPVLYQGDEIGQGDTAVAATRSARSARSAVLARVRRTRRRAHADAME